MANTSYGQIHCLMGIQPETVIIAIQDASVVLAQVTHSVLNAIQAM